MAGVTICDSVIARLRESFAKTGSIAETARECGVYWATARKYLGNVSPKIRKGDKSGERVAGDDDIAESFREHADGTATQTVLAPKLIQTYDDAVAAAGVDTSVWYVHDWECSQWTTPLKIRRDGEDVAIQQQQYRVRLRLKRIMSRSLQAATDSIFARIADHAPTYNLPALPKRPGEKHLACVGLFDAHFGKLCWGAETGNDYDTRIASRVYANAVADLIAESGGRNVGHWLLPIGNDFFHIDNSRNTTYAGTPQDVDSRYAKIIEAGEIAVIDAIEKLMPIAPVDVVWVPGNHDPTTSYHLARVVNAWFRKAKRVAVDVGPSPRKYFRWQSTLLGLTHGNEEKPQTLPALMATERAADWAATRCREWLVGHHHRSRQWQTQPVDTHDGTVVRVLRSIAGTDAWHHRKGYVGATRAAEVYWYGERRGYAGHAVVPVRGAA